MIILTKRGVNKIKSKIIERVLLLTQEIAIKKNCEKCETSKCYKIENPLRLMIMNKIQQLVGKKLVLIIIIVECVCVLVRSNSDRKMHSFFFANINKKNY